VTASSCRFVPMVIAAVLSLGSMAWGSVRAPSRIEGGAGLPSMEGTIAVLTTADGKGCADPRECAQRDALRALLTDRIRLCD